MTRSPAEDGHLRSSRPESSVSKGLLLAGGHGTRLQPFTFVRNKHLLPIANRPMLSYALENFVRAGIRSVGIVLGPKGEGVREFVGDGSRFGLEVRYIDQGEPRGLAHAVASARDFLEHDPFVMHLGDNLLDCGLGPLVSAWGEGRVPAVIGAVQVEHPSYFGVVEFDDQGKITSVSEKPKVTSSNWALVGLYLFTGVIHDVIDRLSYSSRGELEITDAIAELQRRTGKVALVRLPGWWVDAGTPEDLLAANARMVAKRCSGEGSGPGEVEGFRRCALQVVIGSGSQIAPTARLRGPVVIGSHVTIEGDSEIGPGVALGDGTRLQDVEISRSILFDGVEVQGPVSIESSILGSGVRVTGGNVGGTLHSAQVGDRSTLKLTRHRPRPV